MEILGALSSTICQQIIWWHNSLLKQMRKNLEQMWNRTHGISNGKRNMKPSFTNNSIWKWAGMALQQQSVKWNQARANGQSGVWCDGEQQKGQQASQQVERGHKVTDVWAAQCIWRRGWSDALSRAMKRAQCTWVGISESSSASDWQPAKRGGQRVLLKERKHRTVNQGKEKVSNKNWQAEK